MTNHLYGLTNDETTQLNDILDVFSIPELYEMAAAMRQLCRNGYGSIKLVVAKGTIRPDLSSLELPYKPTEKHRENP